MPKTVSVEVPTVDDIKDTLEEIKDEVSDDIEETGDRLDPKGYTTTQKVIAGIVIAGAVSLVVRKIRQLRRTVPVVAEDVETGEVVTGRLITDED